MFGFKFTGVWSKLQHVYSYIFYCPVSKGVSRGASPNVLWIPPVLGEATLAYTSSFPQELLSTTTTHGSLKMLHKWCTFWKTSHVEKSNLQQKVRLWHDANAKLTTFMLGISLPGQRRVAFTATKWRNRIFPFIRVPIVAFLISTVCRGDITVLLIFFKNWRETRKLP